MAISSSSLGSLPQGSTSQNFLGRGFSAICINSTRSYWNGPTSPTTSPAVFPRRAGVWAWLVRTSTVSCLEVSQVQDHRSTTFTFGTPRISCSQASHPLLGPPEPEIRWALALRAEKSSFLAGAHTRGSTPCSLTGTCGGWSPLGRSTGSPAGASKRSSTSTTGTTSPSMASISDSTGPWFSALPTSRAPSNSRSEAWGGSIGATVGMSLALRARAVRASASSCWMWSATTPRPSLYSSSTALT
mmetsp:Transcript_81897/g.219929  ORF Transcript_81897/g.219929 Transcript_81897/m.219929 type:complete len:244 (+) Transcript_81897:1131-1862(+)